MRLSLRAKLSAIAAFIALAFVALIWSSSVLASSASAQLARVQEQLLPKLEVGPRLEQDLDALTRAFQDAVGAKDLDDLAATRKLKDELIARASKNDGALDAATAATLRHAVTDYHQTAWDVSKRLIAGETGEQLITAMSEMQDKQKHLQGLIRDATTFDRAELGQAFEKATRAQETAAQIRLWVGLGCMALVLLLIIWLAQGLLQSVTTLNTGLERFGTGKFDERIVAPAEDELGAVARRANAMADNLQKLAERREYEDWLKAGLAGLARELRGELEPVAAAERAVAFLARYLSAPAAALYGSEGKGFRLLGVFGAAGEGTSKPPERFGPGEGLIGQAAQREEVVVVNEPPDGYLKIRSGLGESVAKTLVLVPLVHAGRVTGVLELALFKAWSSREAELLDSVRETLAIALEVAIARARARTLLVETQRQAEQLLSQEEELRSTNEELQAQQEELKLSNEELFRQRATLEQRNSDLESARTHLEKQAKELATVSAYKSQFLTNMSHELRTPLNSMLLLSNLLSENDGKNLTGKQVEYCRTIYSAGRDLLALINQVLDLAKVESGKQDIRISVVHIDELAERARRVFEPLAKDKGLQFDIDVQAQAPSTIASDRQRLDQILNNLIGNAIKFTEAGRVTLTVRPAAASAVRRAGLDAQRTIAFEVSDTGSGIAAELHDRLFTPFEQVDPRYEKRRGGTGLGLAISRELANLLGGELLLESSVPGHGTRFVCHVPLQAPAEVVASAIASAPAPAPGANEAPLILLVEDDRVFAQTFSDILETQGIAHVTANTGAMALKLAREILPTGIVLDVKLPDLTGYEVMEKLKADPRTASIPVHFVSAMPDVARGMALGAVGYVTKPATKNELLGAVRSLSLKGAPAATHVLVVEDDALVAERLVSDLKSEGYPAQHAATGAAALEALKGDRFACMILDLQLPDLDGLSLLSAIRERGIASPPVVIHTARALDKSETQKLEAYVDAIVLKQGPSTERLLGEVRLFARRMKESKAPPAVPAAATAPVKLDGRTVLVVEDDMRTLYAVMAMLRAKGAAVLTAENGKVALEVLQKHPPPDAVLMDIMMPEMDGYQAIERIRAQPRFQKLPIIALTAKAMRGEDEKCLRLGATAYLPKPLDADKLLGLLAAQLEGGPR